MHNRDSRRRRRGLKIYLKKLWLKLSKTKWNRPLQSDRHWFQNGDSENTEWIKAEYQGIKRRHNSNADYLRKELENIRRSQEKLENSFADTQTELKPIKSRMNNADTIISDVEDRIMKITQTGQQSENKMKKNMKAI